MSYAQRHAIVEEASISAHVTCALHLYWPYHTHRQQPHQFKFNNLSCNPSGSATRCVVYCAVIAQARPLPPSITCISAAAPRTASRKHLESCRDTERTTSAIIPDLENTLV
jgi:hypothetical protein